MNTKIIAKVSSSLVACFLGIPFDNIKVKMNKMKPNSKGIYPYKSLQDCFIKTCRTEGFTRLWVGFTMFYVRIAPHIIIHLFLLDSWQ